MNHLGLRTSLLLAVPVIGIVLVADLSRSPNQPASESFGTPVAVHSVLPTEAASKTILNATRRHREWVSVSAGAQKIRAFIVFPERSDKATTLVVTARKQGASDWIRAVADQAAGEGFIAIVPDVLSGLGPYGGDTNDFANPGAVATALDRLGSEETARRTRAVRDYAVALPAANGKSASLEFDGGSTPIDGGHIQAVVEAPIAGERFASFRTSPEAWTKAVQFLLKQTGDKPMLGENPNIPEDHSAHFGMMMAQSTAPSTNDKKGGRGPAGYPTGKLPNLPAGIFNAHSALMNSKLRKEWVDIPFENIKLHTWVEYPAGDDKAPLVIVMQHGPGMDDWQRALVDQLAQEGFIAISPDLHSGLGPNGGNFDSFGGTDEVMRAMARLTPDDQLKRYLAARDWGMKLPRANGKLVSIGFCMGGNNNFRFAEEVPELAAAVIFYGTPPDQQLLANIKAPVLAFYGDDDARVTSTMAPTEASMKGFGKSFEAHSYAHATHGFLSYQDVGGNPAATADSWPRAVAFLREHTR
jgi:carboxymethylenebutenolidase